VNLDFDRAAPDSGAPFQVLERTLCPLRLDCFSNIRNRRVPQRRNGGDRSVRPQCLHNPICDHARMETVDGEGRKSDGGRGAALSTV